MDPDRFYDRWAEAHGGYDPRGSVWARVWLGVTYRCAVPAARLGVPPHAVTLAGLLVTAAVPPVVWAGWVWVAVPMVALAGLLDSVDGAVAVLTDRATPFGYVLDSVADRVGEALLLVALWLLGAPGWLCVAAGALAWLLEYTRARAVGAGLREIGVVTVWERATRLAVTGAGLLVAAVLPSENAAVVAVVAWAVLGGLGLAQLFRMLRRVLSAPR